MLHRACRPHSTTGRARGRCSNSAMPACSAATNRRRSRSMRHPRYRRCRAPRNGSMAAPMRRIARGFPAAHGAGLVLSRGRTAAACLGSFLAPTQDIAITNDNWEIDFEGEVVVVTDDVAAGIAPDAAVEHVALVMLANDVSLAAGGGGARLRHRPRQAGGFVLPGGGHARRASAALARLSPPSAAVLLGERQA